MSVKAANISLQIKDYPASERAIIWIHQHPTTMKVIQIAALIIAVGLLISLPFIAPLVGLAGVVVLAVVGSLVTIGASCSLPLLDMFIPPYHNMKKHVFKPGKCAGGELYYHGDLPILSLDSKDPYKAGWAQGYLCAEAISKLSMRFKSMRPTLSADALEEIRKTIPDKYLKEMQGIADGYQKRAKKIWPKLSADDVLLLNLIPDSTYLRAENYKHSKERAVACSSLVECDAKKGMVFARNLDWPSFGVAGTYSLVIHRKQEKTVEIGIPGIIGTMTGMNQYGLSVSINSNMIAINNKINGMPMAIYTRACLEQCKNVADVEIFVANNKPLGPYHLTVADEHAAESIHFNTYFSPIIRKCTDQKPLVTLNTSYYDENATSSEERQTIIDRFFKNRKKRPIEKALSLPLVNCAHTTHTIVMEPKTRKFKAAFNNAYTALNPFYTLPTTALFA